MTAATLHEAAPLRGSGAARQRPFCGRFAVLSTYLACTLRLAYALRECRL